MVASTLQRRSWEIVDDLSVHDVDLWSFTLPHLKQIIQSEVLVLGLNAREVGVARVVARDNIVLAPARNAASAMKPQGTSRRNTR